MSKILCLGVDGKIYEVPSELHVVCDEHGIPTGYEKYELPHLVDFVARSYVVGGGDLNEHPLRKAYFKLWAAKEHNIVEKQRPQDVTIDEARQMAKDWLLSQGWAESQANIWIRKYWS